MAEGTPEALAASNSTRFPTFKKWWYCLRACCRPGMFLLLGTLLPYGINFLFKTFWRSYPYLIIGDSEFFTWFDRLIQSVALVAVLSFIIALRVVLRPRKAEEARWDWNRIAAALALVTFAASPVHDSARMVYYSFSQTLVQPPSTREVSVADRLYEVHKRFRKFPEDNSAKFYPALSRMDARYQEFLPERHWRFEREIKTPGLPLRIAIGGRFYYYLGYRVRDDQEIAGYAQAYRQALANPDMPEFLALESAGLERLGSYPIPSSIPGLPLPAKAWSGIPLLIEVIDPEKDTEGHVLFCDGHTERIPYPGHWPMTEATVSQLRALVEESLRASGEDE